MTIGHLINRKCYVFDRARPPGTPKKLFLSIMIANCVLIFHGNAFAQTSPYSQPPSNTSSSRTQPTKTGGPGKTTAGKTQSVQTASGKPQATRTEASATQARSHQAGTQYTHGHSHGVGGVGVGVGAAIDLGGLGQRRAEPDPFAVPAGPRPVTARTEEKPQAHKKPRESVKRSEFTDVELTGEKAKSEITSTDPFRDVRVTGGQAKETNNTPSPVQRP